MIALCTIVKNEEKIIKRMLESTEGFVDAYYILDTGSTDKTVEIIEEWLKTHKGKVAKSEFKGFATSRNEAWDLVPEEYEYILIVDADEILWWNGEVDLTDDKDAYGIYITQSFEATLGARIVRNVKSIRFQREIHNEIIGHETQAIFKIDNIAIYHIHDGKRAYDPNKLGNDVKKLSDGDDTDDFYLAQTYYSMGELHKAYRQYEKVTDGGILSESVYWAHFMMGKIKFDAGFYDMAFFDFMDAYAMKPTLEPLYYMVKIARLFGKHKVARRAIAGAKPEVLSVYIIPDIRNYLFDKQVAEEMEDAPKEALKYYNKIINKTLPENIRKEVEKKIVSLS